MNPLVLFDYVYYSIASLYLYVFKLNDQKFLAGVGVLSIFQATNCLVLLELFEVDNFIEPPEDLIYASVSFFIFNFIRYYKFIHFENLEKKWGNDKKYMWLIKKVLVLVYFILSIAFIV